MSTQLTFFCEMEAKALRSMFDEFPVTDELKALGAKLSLGILDFSPERAEVVRRLNHAKIPVIAWLLLPEEDGYWFNIKNVDRAMERYEQFKVWTGENGLE